MDTIPHEKTIAEVSFIESLLPRDQFPMILDLCCGAGRHAEELAIKGYSIFGVDVNESAILKAQKKI